MQEKLQIPLGEAVLDAELGIPSETMDAVGKHIAYDAEHEPPSC